MFPTWLKKLVCTLFILIFPLYESQVYTQNGLDSITGAYMKSGKFEDAININKRALEQYQKRNNKEGIILATTNIAHLLNTMSKHKESLKYLEKIEKEVEETKSTRLKSRYYSGRGVNYTQLGMYESSNEYLNKALRYAKESGNEEKKNKNLYLCYSWKLINFKELKVPDSIKAMEKKCLAISSNPFLYAAVAERFLDEKKHLDSAEYYLKKASVIADKFPIYDKGVVLFNYGKLYTLKKEHKKALEYYFQALSIFEKIKIPNERRLTYDLISKTYTALNDTEKSDEYLKKYITLNDSIIKEERKAINIPVKNIIEEKEEQKKDEKFQLYIIIIFAILASVLTFYLLRKNNLKKQRQKDKIIHEKQQEADLLKKKVNPVIFNEVKELAKNADPFFLTRFKEVYPEFYENLTSQYPSLTSNELKFCALLRLNLSNKEISLYENLSIRTVETRRYRLRKKLNFASDTDFNKWIMEL